MVYIDKNSLKDRFTLDIMKTHEHIIIDNIDEVPDSKRDIIITHIEEDVIRKCPGTKVYRCCNYYNLDIMQGCPFDCSYCILQAYLPHKRIKVSSNIDDIILQISKVSNKVRLGSGELTDSLAIDNILPISRYLIPIVNKLDNIQFEFKTKSANIDNLLNLNPKNILISWSLNPEEIVSLEEHGTARLKARLDSAKTISDYGYKIGFHFDPLIYNDNFEKLYISLIDELMERIDESSVEFISISTFRAPTELIDKIRVRERRSSSILKSDFITGIDGKIRYHKTLRHDMISTVYNRLRSRWSKVFIYLCMEHSSVWNDILGYDPYEREDFEVLFPYYLK